MKGKGAEKMLSSFFGKPGLPLCRFNNHRMFLVVVVLLQVCTKRRRRRTKSLRTDWWSSLASSQICVSVS